MLALSALIALTLLIDSRPTPAGSAKAQPVVATSVLAPWTGGLPPAFALDDLGGKRLQLEAFNGRVVLLHFFATWCEPCIPELASLQRLALASRETPLAIVAVDVGEVDLRVRAFFEKRPVDFPVLLDRDRAVAKAWDVTALPSTFVLDASLTPRLFVEGDLDWSQPDVTRALADLLPTKSHHE